MWLRQHHEGLFQQFMEASDQKHSQLRADIILPVVVHVVYSSPENNISDAQILSQIDALNRSFGGRVDPSADILSEHRALISSSNIRFQLVCSDPNGTSTSGITRTETTVPNLGFHFVNGRYAVHHNEDGGVDPWPREDYINIWVAEMEDGLLGRATLPIPLGDPAQEGIVISTKHFGYLGSVMDQQPYHLGRTLVHEMGHYLGLQHLWGDGEGSCSTDDQVEDTPNQSEIYYDCPSEQQSSSCGSPDMTKNIMGYTDDACLIYFTQGQVNRMINMLMIERSSLLESDATENCGLLPLTPEMLLFWNRIEAREWIFRFPTSQSQITAEIYNMAGQRVRQFVFQNTDLLNFSTAGLMSGVYIIRFTYNDDMIQLKASVYQ